MQNRNGVNVTESKVVETIFEMLVKNESERGQRRWSEGVSPTAVCHELDLLAPTSRGGWNPRPGHKHIDFVWDTACDMRDVFLCLIRGNTRRIIMAPAKPRNAKEALNWALARIKECDHMLELRMMDADEAIDHGEFSAKYRDENEAMRNPTPCGLCDACKEAEASSANDPWDFEFWKESAEGQDFDEDVLQYMGDCHGHEIHDVRGWNQLAAECQMSVAFP